MFVAIGERLPLERARGGARRAPGHAADGALGARRPCARTPAARAGTSPSTRSRRRPTADPEEALDGFLDDHAEECRRLDAFMRTLSREGTTDMAGLALAVRQLRELAE